MPPISWRLKLLRFSRKRFWTRGTVMKQIALQKLFIGSNSALDSKFNSQIGQNFWNSFYSGKDYQDLLKPSNDIVNIRQILWKRAMSNALWNLDVEMEEIPISLYTQI